MNVRVQIPAGLRAFVDGRSELLAQDAHTVAALLASLPTGVRERVLDEQGRVRRHVNVFVDDTSIRETGGVDTPLRDGAEVWIIPAVSGGRTLRLSWPLNGDGIARRALAMVLLLAACAHPATNKASRPDAWAQPQPTEAQAPTHPPVLFARDVQPILEARCTPCHFPGGVMHERLPFDREATVHQLGEKLFTRIKDPDEQEVIRSLLDQESAEAATSLR